MPEYQRLVDYYNGKYKAHLNELEIWLKGDEGKEVFLVDVKNYIDHFIFGSVLFLGCGTGHRVWSFQQNGFNAHGCDISQFAIDRAVTDNCICCDIRKMPYEDRQFDNVAGFDVLEHVPMEYIDEVIKECHRITNKVFIARIPYAEENTEFARKIEDVFMEHMIHTPPEWWLGLFRKYFSNYAGWTESYERVELAGDYTNWFIFRYERVDA